MFGMGAGELLVVLVIVLLVFGAGRLPEMMGSLGKGMQERELGLEEQVVRLPVTSRPPSAVRCDDSPAST